MTSTYSKAFSVGPAHSYPMNFSFNFYLKHFRSSVVDYILEETGYSELIEYETLCRMTDLFPVYISTNGLLCCDYPIVDETKNKVFALSLHHVRNEVRDWIMEHYIGMNITDYELQYSQYNSIYVVVPYSQYVSDIDRDAESNRGFVIHLDECDCSDEDEHKTDDGDSV